MLLERIRRRTMTKPEVILEGVESDEAKYSFY
jgi:hypothetical protein